MTQRLISKIAIWILALVMIRFGIYHFQEPHRLLEYVPGNLPGGINSVYVVGIAYILAAIAFLTNKFVKIVGYLLAALLIVSVLLIHLPIYNQAGSSDTRQMALIALLKDLAIAAFALHIAGSADAHGVKY